MQELAECEIRTRSRTIYLTMRALGASGEELHRASLSFGWRDGRLSDVIVEERGSGLLWRAFGRPQRHLYSRHGENLCHRAPEKKEVHLIRPRFRLFRRELR